MELYVVRHGKTSANMDSVIMGHLDVPLHPEAQNSIEKIAEQLKGLSFDVIFTSDLSRAKDTAMLLRRKLQSDAPIIEEKMLREVDYGHLQGTKKKETREQHPGYRKKSSFRNPGGETFDELQERVTGFVTSIDGKYNRVLLVTHAGCIRVIYAHYKDFPLDSVLSLPLSQDVVLLIDSNKEHSANFLLS